MQSSHQRDMALALKLSSRRADLYTSVRNRYGGTHEEIMEKVNLIKASGSKADTSGLKNNVKENDRHEKEVSAADIKRDYEKQKKYDAIRAQEDVI